ncbi:MAG: oligoendopeptidase F, partial [Clostridia bacterium]|nr:oligoendopeptidase F [Clostridia bacterium]
MAKQKSIPKRSEVEKQYTWATEDLFATDALWEEALEAAKAYPEKLAAYRGRISASAEDLLGYMQLNDEIQVKVERLGNYAMRKSDEDTGNSFYQAMKGKIMNLYMTIESADSFSTPELISIPDDTMEAFYNAAPGLRLYSRKISKIRHFKPHTLSDAEERILALSGQ